MNRDELIVAAWHDIRPFMQTDEVVIRTIDAVEPLIRADERKRIAAGLWPLVEPITSWIAGVNR